MMPAGISVIIPALDEEASIARAIRSCRKAGPCEVIVADGGSRDRTVEIARGEADAVITAPRGRAAQMNEGAAVARGNVLLFLHADTVLPGESVPVVLGALQDPACDRRRLPRPSGRVPRGGPVRPCRARDHGADDRGAGGRRPGVHGRPGDLRAGGDVPRRRRLPGDPADGGRRAVASDAAGGKDGPAAASRANVGTALGGVGPPPHRPLHVAPPDRLPPREDADAMRGSVPPRTGTYAPGTPSSQVIRRGVKAFARSGCRGRTRAANPYRPLPAQGISTR